MRKFFKRVVFWVNILLASALVISYLSVIINPAKIAWPAYFGLAYPYLLLANFVFAVFWGVKLRREALVSIAAILLGITHLNNFIQLKGNSSEEYDFAVTTYNVRLFNRWEESKKTEVQVIALLEQSLSDIICFQEFYPTYGPANVRYTFVDALDPDYYFHMKLLDNSGKKSPGLLTVSRFPIIRSGDIIHPESASLTIWSDMIIEEDTVRVYNNHLQSFRLRRMERSFLEEIYSAYGENGMEEFRSLSHSLKTGFVLRAEQARAVKDHMKTSPYPVIVCGDFNDTPVSYSYRKIRKGLKDTFVEAGSGAGFTYKDKYPSNRIDYILYDPHFGCRGFEVTRVDYSDHYPVTGYFSYRAD